MNVQNNCNFNSPHFTSRLNPIPKSIVNTTSGKLTLREAMPSELQNPKFLEKLAKFFCDNFSSNTDDPSWLAYSTVPKKIQKNIVDTFVRSLKDIFKNDDGNMTLLLAKDKRSKIQGACLSYGYDFVDGSKDYTLYIDSIAVNKNFRGLKLGKQMLQKTIDANKDNSKFTDVFLVGEKRAHGFYKKFGFSDLKIQDPDQRKVINFLAIDRRDYPEYADFLTYPLKKEQPRWYAKAASSIHDGWL